MGRRSQVSVTLCLTAMLLPGVLHAQDAKAIVQQAVNAEMEASHADRSKWRYRETEMDGNEFVVVETQYGEVKRHTKENGHAPSAELLRKDDEYNQRFAHDTALQEKQRQAGLHDDRSATELLNEMPVAFVWKLERDGADEYALSYKPNPDYNPPDMESRVMGQMAGTLVVSKPDHRIKTFKGTLTNDIEIGWGLLAKIRQEKVGSFIEILNGHSTTNAEKFKKNDEEHDDYEDRLRALETQRWKTTGAWGALTALATVAAAVSAYFSISH